MLFSTKTCPRRREAPAPRDGAGRGCRVDFIQGPRAVERVFELTGALQQLSFVDAVSPLVAATTA